MFISQAFRRCVFFISIVDGAGTPKLGGSGFFLGMPDRDNKYFCTYAVTARHCIEDAAKASQMAGGDRSVYLRINEVGGGARTVRTDADSWFVHPSADVASFILNDAPWMDAQSLHIDMCVNQKRLDDQEIGFADDVYTVGLFRFHGGANRNIPIVRHGIIAAMPEEPVRTKRYGPIDAFLIECRSIGGLSGSPVYVVPTIRPVEDNPLEIRGSYLSNSRRLELLGLIQGHWDADETFVDAISGFDRQANLVNVGIAIVTPATKLIELLDRPDVRSSRDHWFANHPSG